MPAQGQSSTGCLGSLWLWSSLGSLVVYGLGMGSVVLALTLVAAVFKAGMATRLRVLLPYVRRIGTSTLLIAGAYIAYVAHRSVTPITDDRPPRRS